MASVYDAWEQFVLQQQPEPVPLVRPLVRESWQRCRSRGQGPHQPLARQVAEPELRQRRQAQNSLLRVAKPMLEKLYDSVRAHSFVILLLDADCCALEVLGNPDFLAAYPLFRPGELWGEADKGTNAMALAQASRKPQQVVAAEHYARANHPLTCSAAPIYSPNGQFLGLLDVSGQHEQTHAHTLGMVIAAAKAIEEGLRLETANQEIGVNARLLRTVIENISEGVITLDGDGFITNINKTAFRLLQQRQSDCRGKAAASLLPNQRELLERVLKQAQIVAKSELTLEKKKIFLSGYPIIDQRQTVCGAVLTLTGPDQVGRHQAGYATAAQARTTFDDIIGQSEKLRRCLDTAQNVASSSASIYLEGESGTGKEMFAQAIHNASAYADGPFVAISCGAIPRNLLESELFGYEDGTFSGGKKGGKAGKFELANNGTLFLDEIADMPLDTQVSLLRVLQEKQVVRIGGYHPIPINIRILSATNKCLEEEVRLGHFREDLFYRLNVIKIELPPLRAREQDILLLARHFVSRFVNQLGLPEALLSEAVRKTLCSYHWPGNIRELGNALECAVNLAQGQEIRPEHLPETIRSHQADRLKTHKPDGTLYPLDEAEKMLLAETLQQMHGNISRSAAHLGMSRNTLYRKIKKYQLEAQ